MTHFPSKRSSRPGAVPVAASALGAAGGGRSAPAPVAVAPDTRRAAASVPEGEPNILPQGTGQDRSGTAIVYDTPVAHGVSTGGATVRIAAHGATVRIAAHGVTARHPALGDDADEAAHEPNGEQVPAVGTTRDRLVLEDTVLPGDQDTLITDGPGPDVASRVRVHDSCPEGDVGLLRGRATTAVELERPRRPGGEPAAAARVPIRGTGARTRTVADHLRGSGHRAPHAHR
ncbi:hypothetical protein [Streptomyces sp. NPDC057052]|uniref:hypothetical protein n=1 Tax=Streptomyces sp. NPDC057052 TaxID=3346010 RepID=UPI00363B87D2